jgi:hypothetical protein
LIIFDFKTEIMVKKILVVIVFGFWINICLSQSYYFGIKGGPSVGYQKWETYNQSVLLTYHVYTFWESYSEDNPLNALYANFGYHNRGSALRGSGFVYAGEYFRMPTQKFIFSNLSLALGAKRRQNLTRKMNSFYAFGLRADYNIHNNLREYAKINSYISSPYFPVNAYVNKFTYGAQVAGGIELVFSELLEGIFEISVNPDLSNQYDQPELYGVYNPYEPSNTITLPRRRIKNTTVEITFGLRFMRKVIYID